MFVLLMPMEEKEGAVASAEACTLAVSDGSLVDMVRDENGMLADLAATMLETRFEARNREDGLGGMTRVFLFTTQSQLARKMVALWRLQLATA